MKAMTDDKGLFQGGEEGRMFGRTRDMIMNRKDSGAAVPSTPGSSPAGTPSTSPEFQAFMKDKTPENLRAWQISHQPGGAEAYNKRFTKLKDEGMSEEFAQTNAWDYWGSESSEGFEKSGSFDHEFGEVDKIRMGDYRKYKESGDRTEYGNLWGSSSQPTLFSSKYVGGEFGDMPKFVGDEIQSIMNPGVPKRDYANPTDGNPFYNRGTKAQREPDPRIENAGY